MPVDYLPCIVFVIFGFTLVATIVAFVKKASRKLRIVSLFFLLIVPIFYIWIYHSKELFLLSAAENGDPQAALKLGRSTDLIRSLLLCTVAVMDRWPRRP